jgi:hypothetical protein
VRTNQGLFLFSALHAPRCTWTALCIDIQTDCFADCTWCHSTLFSSVSAVSMHRMQAVRVSSFSTHSVILQESSSSPQMQMCSTSSSSSLASILPQMPIKKIRNVRKSDKHFCAVCGDRPCVIINFWNNS